MAQQTKNSSKSKSSAGRKSSASRSGSRAQSSRKTSASKSSRKNGASKRPSSKRSNSKANGSRPRRVTKPGGASRSVVAEAASKVKTPLVAAGTALIGVAAGAAFRNRLDGKGSKNPLRHMPGVPKSVRNADLGKIDLDTVKKAAERVSAYGQQASDIASAVEKTRKKNK